MIYPLFGSSACVVQSSLRRRSQVWGALLQEGKGVRGLLGGVELEDHRSCYLFEHSEVKKQKKSKPQKKTTTTKNEEGMMSIGWGLLEFRYSSLQLERPSWG